MSTVNQTAAAFGAARFCGRADTGISKLTIEDLRQIEAHRAGSRPTPWPHLALRYGVNEIDLRGLFESANDDRPKGCVEEPLSRQEAGARRNARFREMWIAGVPRSAMAEAMGMDIYSIDRTRARLGLAKRERVPRARRSA